MNILWDWLEKLHRITGDIAISRGKANEKDLTKWISILDQVKQEMGHELEKIKRAL